jgi:Domain of unknown function (DUF6702)
MLGVLAITFSLFIHQDHVSMTSIDYVKGTDSLKVYCSMYFDDFLDDLQTIDDDRDLNRLFVSQPYPTDLINQYFNSKVFIYVNKKLLAGKLLTVNIADKKINMSLIYRADKKPRSIKVKNLILTGWFSDQTNLTILRMNDLEKGIRLTREHNEETFIVK